MRDKLIDLVRRAIIDWWYGDAGEHIADHLIANGVTIQKWIPVTERLPAGDTVVLCYRADRRIMFGILLDATYADGVQAFMDRDRVFAFGATHWMPLPEPPKED